MMKDWLPFAERSVTDAEFNGNDVKIFFILKGMSLIFQKKNFNLNQESRNSWFNFWFILKFFS